MVLKKKEQHTFEGLTENITEDSITEYSALETDSARIAYLADKLGLIAPE